MSDMDLAVEDGVVGGCEGDGDGDLRHRASGPTVSHGDSRRDQTGLRFADVCATLPLAEPLADTLAGPQWAAAWADAIVCFWETEYALGTLDVDQPLYVLDVTPGRGVLAWLLVQAIEDRLSSSGVAGVDWRYLVCDDGCEEGGEAGEVDAVATASTAHETLQRLRAHPRFAVLIETGRVDTARWSISTEGALRPDGRQTAMARLANPVVAVAAGWCSRQRADLYAAHYGQWLEAEVDIDVSADAAAYTLSYRWQPASTDDLPPAWAPLAERYVASLVSACVLLPTGAMSLVDSLRRLSGDRYLLLACDIGASSETDLRDGALSAPDAWLPGVTSVPVNFHALAWRQPSAWVMQRQTDAHDLAVQAVWSRAGIEPPMAARLKLTDIIEGCEPCDARRLAQVAESVAEHAPLDTLATLLRASAYDPAVLAAMLPHWSARSTQLSGASNEAAQMWRRAFARTWRHHLPDTRTAQFDAQLASAVAALGDWQLAKEIWRSVLVVDENTRFGGVGGVGETRRLGEENAANVAQVENVARAENEPRATNAANDQHHARWRACVHLHLAHCLASSGELPEACKHVAHAHSLDPDDPDVHAWQTELEARAARRRALPWYRPELARDADLSIEPLGVEHADALLAAFTDPHLAALANLPSLNEPQDVRTWLEADAAEAGRTSYAVMDAWRGFVGVVSLCRAGEAAHFYFWIDAHAQGQGYGTRAARLLFEQARADGIADIFTASYAENARSHAALRRLGFDRLPVRPAAEPEVGFFHLCTAPATTAGAAAHVSLKDTIARFTNLCEAIDAPVELAVEAA
ncbi:GNAT family N-acetyltransferase [Paraburkholderia bryophila]|uniref:GNAT family N-acetyltransferase n=1 Tax=Paraburkholderia bryophila TaxID=420952 RepID=UPI0023491E72|nr:GNAT family N-acetyltransferase [Paraburkholderia bryophila]WCM24489.1 GNAT family N-acetyltransferase [Paraburkholderia bryophila]